MNRTNQTQEQPIIPISPETATIIIFTVISIAIINTRLPTKTTRTKNLTQEQINNLPPDQKLRLQQYQQALQQETQPTTVFQTTTTTETVIPSYFQDQN
ncbi:9736_t:CDS:2, partial [Racocetra persica]